MVVRGGGGGEGGRDWAESERIKNFSKCNMFKKSIVKHADYR